MMSYEEVSERMKVCRTCNEKKDNAFKDFMKLPPIWDYIFKRECKECAIERYEQLQEEHFVKDYNGYKIYEYNSRYYLGLGTGLSLDSLEDAELYITHLNKRSANSEFDFEEDD